MKNIKVITAKKGQRQSDHHQHADESQEEEEIQQYESQDIQAEDLSWKSFYNSKKEIESTIKQMIPLYFQYQQLLYESAKEICLQSKMTRYDCQQLKPSSKLTLSNIQKMQQEVGYSVEQKCGMIDKIINERRIKRYYKEKHEINFQDQLDPEDDEKQIYKFYREVFQPKTISTVNNTLIRQNLNLNTGYNQSFDFNQQLSYKPILPFTPQLQTPHEINIKPPNNQSTNNLAKNTYLSPENHNISFQQQSKTPYLAQPSDRRLHKNHSNHQINDPFKDFQHDLSFDVKEDRMSEQNKTYLDMDDIYNEMNSEMNIQGKKRKKKGLSKREQEASNHPDSMFRNFIDKQNEQLGRQKMRVQELSEKALKVLNNQLFEEEGLEQAVQDQSSKLKYLFNEIIEIYAVIQSLKYYLKFKSFELLSKLYENASNYYREKIEFFQPIERIHFLQIIKALMPEQEEEEDIRIIADIFFEESESVVFDDFIEKLSPLISQKQFNFFQEMDNQTNSNRLLDLAVRLFNLWIELNYFEKQTRKLLQDNQHLVDTFIDETSENSLVIVPQKMAEFISKTKKNMKIKKMKCEIYCRNILGQKMLISEFFRWVGKKQRNFQVEDEYNSIYTHY